MFCTRDATRKDAICRTVLYLRDRENIHWKNRISLIQQSISRSHNQQSVKITTPHMIQVVHSSYSRYDDETGMYTYPGKSPLADSGV